MTPLLEVNGLEVRYGQTQALRGISLHIDEGEAVSIVGVNGAGKTSTLHVLAGVVRAVAGTVGFRGQELRDQAPEVRVRQGLALVPEGRQIFATLTVEENLRLATFTKRHADPSVALEREYDRFPVLRRYAKQHAGALSGGEQQQLAISRALLCKPELLLLDEPSLGLAPKIVDTVFSALRDLRAEGVTILLVEQNAARAVRFADRSYVLNGGRVELTGTRDELVGDRRIEESYLGQREASS